MKIYFEFLKDEILPFSELENFIKEGQHKEDLDKKVHALDTQLNIRDEEIKEVNSLPKQLKSLILTF